MEDLAVHRASGRVLRGFCLNGGKIHPEVGHFSGSDQTELKAGKTRTDRNFTNDLRHPIKAQTSASMQKYIQHSMRHNSQCLTSDQKLEGMRRSGEYSP